MKASDFNENILPYRLMLAGGKYYPQVFSTVWENFEVDSDDDDDDDEDYTTVCFDTEAEARAYLKMRAERRLLQYREYLSHRDDQAEHIRLAEVWIKNIDSAVIFTDTIGQ